MVAAHSLWKRRHDPLDLGSKHQVRAVAQADSQGAKRGSEHARVCMPCSVQARVGGSDATEY